jgi:hypothetical protein
VGAFRERPPAAAWWRPKETPELQFTALNPPQTGMYSTAELVRAGAPGTPEQLFYAYLPPMAMASSPSLLLPQKKYFTVQVPVTSADYDAFRRSMACQKTQFSADELKRVAAAPLTGPVRLVPALSTGAATDLFEPLH